MVIINMLLQDFQEECTQKSNKGKLNCPSQLPFGRYGSKDNKYGYSFIQWITTTNSTKKETYLWMDVSCWAMAMAKMCPVAD